MKFLYFSAGVLLGGILVLFMLAEPVNSEIPFTEKSPELMSPHDHVKEEQIHVYDERVVIDIEAEWARFMDTNSMDPLIDEGANAIQIVPDSKDDVHVGDVVSYKSDKGIIIHRVIDIGNDEEGTYYTVKGDNNREPDPKVRFEQIEKVLVGVIY